MTHPILLVATFAGGTFLVLGAYSLLDELVLRKRTRVKRRLQEEFGSSIDESDETASLFKNFDELITDSEQHEGVLRRLQIMIEQSGLWITPWQLISMSASACVALAVASWFLTGSWMVVLAGAVAGGVTPVLYVRMRRQRRIQKLCLQLPDAFDVMSRAAKAGQTATGAFQIVAHDFEAPLGTEFAYCYEQQNLGIPHDVALRDLARRTGVMELQIFVVALLVQRRTGGNLVELLNNLSTIVRQRIRFQGRVKALTGEGRMQAVVLMVLPLLVLAAMFGLNGDYAQSLLNHPRLLAGTFLLQAMGVVWIRQIVNFDY